jgi:hypothetical protein
MPIYVVKSGTVMLAGNPGAVGPVGNPQDVTREILVAQTPGVVTNIPGVFVGITIATAAAPGSGDVTLLRTSASDGGGSQKQFYVVRNNRTTPSEFQRTSVHIYGGEFSPPPPQ